MGEMCRSRSYDYEEDSSAVLDVALVFLPCYSERRALYGRSPTPTPFYYSITDGIDADSIAGTFSLGEWEEDTIAHASTFFTSVRTSSSPLIRPEYAALQK